MLWFEKAFPRDTCKWTHKFSDFHAEYDGAVVVINGAAADAIPEIRNEQMRFLNDQLRNFRWVLLVSIGDEGSGQHLEFIDHPRASIWIYDPKPGKYPEFHSLPAGPLQQVQECLPNMVGNKTWDWSWTGSIRDIKWDAEIRALPGNGKYCTGHLGHEGYTQLLLDSKVVPCRPSWTSPETCRLYDALEAGCVPIVGTYPSENPPGHCWWRNYKYDWPHFWENVLGETPPFPVITSSDQLAGAVQMALAEWPANAQRISTWWNLYKARLIDSLQAEVRRLQQ